MRKLLLPMCRSYSPRPYVPITADSSLRRGLRCLQDLPLRHLCALAEDSHGERGARSQGASGSDPSPTSPNPDPLVKFKKEDVALVYGSLWKQRYFKKVGDDYFPLGAQWDIDARRPSALISPPITRIGGCPIIPPTTCSGPPARCAMAAIRSTTTSAPRPSQSGTSAASAATDPGGDHINEP